jgi:hypothetical protein
MAKRVKSQNVNVEATNKEIAGMKPSGGNNYKFRNGYTAFFPVISEGRSTEGCFQPVSNVFIKQDGSINKSTQFCFYALLWDTQEVEEGLPENAHKQLNVVYVPRTLAMEIAKSVLPSTSFTGKEKRGSFFSTIDGNGEIAYGDMYTVSRTGRGLETRYTLAIEEIDDDYAAQLPGIIEPPGKTIEEVAKDANEYQRQKLESNTRQNPDLPETTEF